MGNCVNCFRKSDATEFSSYRSMLRTSKKTKQNWRACVVHPMAAPIFDDNLEMDATRKCSEEDDEKRVITRVKVTVTKKEAAQLLAKFIGGHMEMMQYIKEELRKVDDRRRCGDGSSRSAWRPTLESIPEGC